MSANGRRVLREGFVAGFLGYAAVVLLFAILNLLAGQGLFHTPRVLGSALLGPALDPPGPAPILAYNGLHLIVSLALGVGAAFLAGRAEEDHDLGSGLVFFVLALGGWVPIFFGALTVEWLQALTWTEVVAGSAVGAVATLGYVALSHRPLVRALFAEARV
jgi:hypothetical protein